MNGHYELGETVLGNWKLVRLLGEGSYGKVYEAHREDFGTIYKAAIKIITIPKSQGEVTSARAEGMDEVSVTAYFHSFVERIAQEFALMSQLKGTANVVSYEDHDTIPHDGTLGWDIIIRMELLTPLLNYTIAHEMRRSDIIKLGADMCRALELCQRQNIMHRDIKPENIFVSELGDYKLGDFGIARTMEATTGATKAGTYPYMAPEVYKEQPYNATVDIYSLGIVLYQLLNDGRTPFLPPYPTPIRYSDRDRAISARMSGEQIPPPKKADAPLAAVVLRACAYDPKDRYERASQMREALEALLRDALREEEAERGAVAEECGAAGDETTGLASEQAGNIRAAKAAGAVGRQNRELQDEDPLDATVGLFGDRPNSVERQEAPEEGGTVAGSYPVAAPQSTETGPVAEAAETPNRQLNMAAKRVAERLGQLGELLKGLPRQAKIAGAEGCAVLLAAIILASSLGGDKHHTDAGDESAVSGGGKAVFTQTGSEEAAETPTDLMWSEWAASLPEGTELENSAIEARLEYRSTPLYQAEGEAELPEGSVLFDSSYGEFGEWSDWQSDYIESNDSTEVETRSNSVYVPATGWTRTRLSGSNVERREISYNNRTTTVTEYRRKAGYTTVTQYRSRVRELIRVFFNPDEWSDYSATPIRQNEGILVNYRMQYRSAMVQGGRVAEPSIENFPVFTEDYTARFRDVDDDAWFGANKSDILRTVSELGILLPDSYMRFYPDRNITTGQVIRAAVMINRIYHGYTGLLGENNGDYQIYADYAVSAGIIRQGELTDLAKDATRQEMAYIFYNSLPESEIASKRHIEAITDMDMGYRYYDCALAMAEAGIISLNGNDEYRPEDTATRAEAASIINKLIYPEHRA